MDLIYWYIRLSTKEGGGWGFAILANIEHSFIRVHENLKQHPCNNISIIVEIDFKHTYSYLSHRIINRFPSICKIKDYNLMIIHFYIHRKLDILRCYT